MHVSGALAALAGFRLAVASMAEAVYAGRQTRLGDAASRELLLARVWAEVLLAR